MQSNFEFTWQNVSTGFEGLCLTVYRDQNGYRTIGYGHKILPGEVFTTITQAEALALFNKDMGIHSNFVNSLGIATNQNEFNSLTDLCYNIGNDNFSNSTLLKKLQNRTCLALPEVSFCFLEWCRTNGQINEGLLYRRGKEVLNFFGVTA